MKIERADNGPETSSGMLRDLGRGLDSSRWTEFVTAYTPLLRLWLHGIMKAHPAIPRSIDDDIIQETLVALMKSFPTLKYDPTRGKFRAYLHGVLRNTTMKVMERYRLTKGSLVDFNSDSLDNAAATGLDSHASSGHDLDSENLDMLRDIWRMLLEQVFSSGRYSEQTKAIFKTSMTGRYSSREVAEMYGTTENNVNQIRNRILSAVNKKKKLASKGGDLFDLLETLSAEELDNARQE